MVYGVINGWFYVLWGPNRWTRREQSQAEREVKITTTVLPDWNQRSVKNVTCAGTVLAR